jgi:hypothetical protein
MQSIKSTFNGIQCHSFYPSYQAFSGSVARMFKNCDFRVIRLSEQAENSGSELQRNVGLRVESRSVRGVLLSFRGSAQRLSWPPLSPFFSEKYHWRPVFKFGRVNMPIRGHASPRRGKKHGGRDVHSPCRVSPLTVASPSSPGYEDLDSDTDNSVQMITFRYIRRTNRPIVSALITVVFTEEEDIEGKGKGILDKPEQSSNKSPQDGSQEDSSYQPSTQSHPDDDSTGIHAKEQNEALREICGLIDMEISSPKAKNLPAEEKPPERFFGARLYPVLPPGYLRFEDIPCGVEVDFLPDPEREAEEWEAEQKAAKQKAEEDKMAEETGTG